MDKMFQLPRIDLPVQTTIRQFLQREPEGPLAQPRSFQMRIFPRREIVSDMVRFSRVPFCGMRPFLRLIERVAVRAAASPCSGDEQRCRLDFVEGGPHLGDCTLWATAVLEMAGVPHFGVGYEPLPDASALFKESVHANGWEGQVVVVRRAMAAKTGETVRLAYYPGHNGEGTTVRAGAAHCGKHCTGFTEIPTVSLDVSWPALRPAALEVLKLSVNGEELNALRGARSLLSRRQVCSVLLHVNKVQRGWADEPLPVPPAAPSSPQPAASDGAVKLFSQELYNLLGSVGGLEVSLHLDVDVHGKLQGDDRPRPSVRRLHSAADLDAVFMQQATAYDYFIARQVDVADMAPCAGSLALKYWDEVFG